MFIRRFGQIAFIAITLVVIVLVGEGEKFLFSRIGITYLILWTVWWVVTAIGRKRGRKTEYSRQQKFIIFLYSCLLIPGLVVVPPFEYSRFSGPIQRDSILSWIGLAVFGFGIALQSWAMYALKGFFTTRMGIQQGHQLITTGPYRFARHPGYLSYLISMAGIGLSLSSIATFVMLIIVIPFLLWRIRKEEEMMSARFGEQYLAYTRKTKKLAPYFF